MIASGLQNLGLGPGQGQGQGLTEASIFLLDRQPHGVECQSLCSSEVTRKIKQLIKSRGGHVSQCPIAGVTNVRRSWRVAVQMTVIIDEQRTARKLCRRM